MQNLLATTTAATLKTSLSQTTDLLGAMTTMSSDMRTQTVNLISGSREAATLQLQAAQAMTEQLLATARRMSFEQAAQASQLQQSLVSPFASQTSLLGTAMRMLGTKDPISYQRVAGADVPLATDTKPYATGDELITAEAQQIADNYFEQFRAPGGIGDNGDLGPAFADAAAGSDLADFGFAGY